MTAGRVDIRLAPVPASVGRSVSTTTGSWYTMNGSGLEMPRGDTIRTECIPMPESGATDSSITTRNTGGVLTAVACSSGSVASTDLISPAMDGQSTQTA